MGVPKIRAAATSLALVGAATLTAAPTAAPAQSAATTTPVAVSISSKRVVTMPTTIQPGVNTFKVTSAAKQGSGFQLVKPAPGYTASEASRDIDKGLEQGNIKALKRFEANVTLLGGMAARRHHRHPRRRSRPGQLLGVGHQHQRPGEVLRLHRRGCRDGQRDAGGRDDQGKAGDDVGHEPASIPHKGLLTFKNAASNNHFIEMGKLKKGYTYKDFKKWFASAQQGPPQGPSPVNFDIGLGSGVVSPGYSATFNYNLPKGDYVMLCFWPDASMGGMPHAFMGMHRVITLK